MDATKAFACWVAVWLSAMAMEGGGLGMVSPWTSQDGCDRQTRRYGRSLGWSPVRKSYNCGAERGGVSRNCLKSERLAEGPSVTVK